jgi:predicted nuclease of predicted toxin-antitoxin system
MRLYLDDDSVSTILVHLLRQAGHDVQLPIDVGLVGEDDPVHLTHAIDDDRIFLSHNHNDFEDLHNLLMIGQGHHPGILIARKDNNPKRDLDERGIVRALNKLLASNLPIPDHFHILNQWR